MMDPGTCIGEISFYFGSLTPASVVAEDHVVSLRLSRRRLLQMEGQDPPEPVAELLQSGPTLRISGLLCRPSREGKARSRIW